MQSLTITGFVSKSIRTPASTISPVRAFLALVALGLFAAGAFAAPNDHFHGSSPISGVATTTSVTANPSPATLGKSLVLKATVTPASGGDAMGTVSFSLDGVALGSATLSSGTATLTTSTPQLSQGTYPVTATYKGSTGDEGSTSPSVSLEVKPAGTALSACADLTKAGPYYLSENVTSTGTCFFIDADNITLNLNGHTITYGTGGGSASTPAILLADTWYTAPGYSLAKTGSTDSHGGFVLFGGSITSSKSAPNRSPAIWVGQSNDISPAPVIEDVTMTTYTEDSSPIFGTVSMSGWKIYNNTINYASTTTSSRYNFYGYAIWIGDQLNAPGIIPDQIYNNKIIGAPQGGIMDDDQNAQIHNNNITFNSFYANDYCVITYSGNNQVINENTCHPTSGRGIDMEAAGGQVTNNTITVTELPQVAEYNGCELGGADGIRVRDNAYQGAPSAPVGVVISGNVITATATKCQANALRLTNLQVGDSVTYTKNKITTSGAGTAAIPDYGISYDGDNQPTLTYSGNSIKSQYAYIQVDWDGANVAIPTAQTWQGTPTYMIDNENGFYDSNDSPPTFSQSINVEASAGGSLKCGTYAAGPTKFGSASTTCN